MPKEMLINVSEGEECRIALLDDGKLEELYMERTSSTSHVGNIYKGRVTNVEPSIQAAFVDFGLGRNGFLHISDLMPSYFGRAGSDIQESVGKKMARRDRPPIQRCLRRGDEIIVQIIKEGIGTKGPTLSSYVSIPGRILVMMPGMGKMGVSKKIEDEEERRRLRTILDSLKPPKGVGFIIRTAGIGKSKAEIQRDLTYLSRLWMQIEKKRTSGSGPMELYTEGDLVTRTVRDVFAGDVDRLIVDNEAVGKRVKEVIKITAPRTKNKVEVYNEPIPLFHKYGIERDIEMMYSRHVPLPSGGSLVIDSTEAIVAIDVNSGKFRDHSDAEMTAFKTDMEAADEIPRQLKLRDLGGVIICDFIDLRYERHRRELEERLHENFKKDRAKTKVLRMSQFGIIEITRQRMRPSLKRSIYFDCPHCKGAGLVKTPESMSLDVMRRLTMASHNEKVTRIELAVCPDVSFYLLNKKRRSLSALEQETGKKILVRHDQTLGLDEMKLDLFDSRDGLVVIEELGLVTNQPPHTTQLGTRPHGGGRGGRGGGRDQRGGGRGGRDQRGGHGGGGGRGQQPHQQQQRDRDEEYDREEAVDAADAAEAEEHDERDAQRTPADPALVAKIAPTIVHDVPQGGKSNARAVSDSADDDADEADDYEEDEEESNVVDVEDGHSSLGERPAGEWDRPGYRGHGGGGGNRGGGHGGDRAHGGGGGGGNAEQGGRRRRRRGRRGGGRDDNGGGAPHGDNRQGGGNQQGGGRQPQPQHQSRGGGGGSGGGRQDNRGGGGRDQRGGGGRQDNRRGGGQQGGGFQVRGDEQPRLPNQPYHQQRPSRPSIPPAAAMANYDDEDDAHLDEHEEHPSPGNERPPGEGQDAAVAGGAQGGGAGADGAGEGGEGGRKRRRRRGGRRHRRRRERERQAELGLTGLPQDDDEAADNGQFPAEQPATAGGAGAHLDDDDADDDDDDRDEAALDDRGPRDADRDERPAARQPAREPEPEAEPEPEPEPEPLGEAPTEIVAPEPEPEADAKPAKSTKKPAARKKKAASATSRAKKPTTTSTTSSRRATAKRTPPKKSAAAAAAAAEAPAPVADAPVVKTGSADKHLADDEPVEPVSAPRRPTRRLDLDEIPDDYD